MEWLANNWFLVVVLLVFLAMHLSGRGCCGGHRNRQQSNKDENGKENSSDS
ncbi:DUF2933 domain-containing protein [Syntrophotalea acetylenivorans]|uniref:DUF2933 domain-containing protein n=1 Tax=Syntrophotalea acetylenivorans TaxID=1842532 RepID=UPI000A8EF90A|nr:DUF2933 domain-containing protein [Syntrophotalea acetylenivorans]